MNAHSVDASLTQFFGVRQLSAGWAGGGYQVPSLGSQGLTSKHFTAKTPRHKGAKNDWHGSTVSTAGVCETAQSRHAQSNCQKPFSCVFASWRWNVL